MRRSNLSSISSMYLTAELARRERALPGLRRRHEQVLGEVRDVAAQIAALGGTPNGAARRTRTRPYRRATGNKQTLVAALSALLRGRTMRVIDAAAAVRKAGYRTTSRYFRTQVAFALARGPFRRLGRGRYTAASAPGAPPSAPAPSGKGTPGRRRRGGVPGPRPGSVVSTLLQVLKGKTMTVTEAVAAVRKAGYKSKATAKSFYSVVAVALSQSGRFRRVGRGRYTGK